jgi:hypothetical protein
VTGGFPPETSWEPSLTVNHAAETATREGLAIGRKCVQRRGRLNVGLNWFCSEGLFYRTQPGGTPAFRASS